MNEKLQSLVEERRIRMQKETSELLTESYDQLDNGQKLTGADYLTEAKNAYRNRYGKEMPINVEACLLTGLKGTKDGIRESMTKSSDTGTFVDYGYQLVSAILPNLVLEEMASLQPLKVRTGDVFWMDYLFAGNKGKIKANDKLFDATSGPSTNLNYANEVVEQEALLVNGTNATGTIAYSPMRVDQPIKLAYSIGGTAYEVTGVHSSGTITFTQAASLTSAILVVATGAYAIVFSSAPEADTVNLSYEFVFQDNQTAIQKVKIALRQLSVTAREYKLSSQYTLDASYDLQQAHNIDVDPLMVAALASTIRYEIDSIGLNEIKRQAGNGTYQVRWNKRVPLYIDIFQHYRSFLVALTEGSNIIFDATKMVGGNIVAAGLNVMSVIEGMGAPHWEPILPNGEMGTFAGPHVAGILNKRWKVIKNPSYGANDFVIGHKGGDYLNSGFVLAPYRPLYTTPPIPWEDDTVRRGMAMSAGMRMLNKNLFVKGEIYDQAYS